MANSMGQVNHSLSFSEYQFNIDKPQIQENLRLAGSIACWENALPGSVGVGVL